MNYTNLHELINRYESNIDMLYGTEHYELFKWEAVKTWRDAWLKPGDMFSSFGERFAAARKGLGWFMDNSRMHPSTGVIKLWEKEPETVEKLFHKLFAKTRDIHQIQQQMDVFIEEYEALRQRHFPGNWSYKQDRHSASVFLAMNDPDFNYVFKSNEAHTMAKYTEFGMSIGAGGSFSLENYYLLCEEIVKALKEHESLLEKHFGRLTDKCYHDESLHLLAFDLMYCSSTYQFYKGLVIPVTGKTIKKPVKQPLSKEQMEEIEAARQQKIQALEEELSKLERQIGDFENISLIGVQVQSAKYGTGTVIKQEINHITVQFENETKAFILDEKYSSRLRFEDDSEIVSAFTEYARTKDRIDMIHKELRRSE